MSYQAGIWCAREAGSSLSSLWIWLESVPSSIFYEVSVPRFFSCQNQIQVQLHGFWDASEAAYGACIFIRSTDESDQFTVKLLSAKSKVAPLKKSHCHVLNCRRHYILHNWLRQSMPLWNWKSTNVISGLTRQQTSLKRSMDNALSSRTSTQFHALTIDSYFHYWSVRLYLSHLNKQIFVNRTWTLISAHLLCKNFIIYIFFFSKCKST